MALLLPCIIEISVFNANNVDPDQMLLSMASDLDLHRLSVSFLREPRLKLVKYPLMCLKNCLMMAKSTDLDQMMHSDLNLYCLFGSV